MGKNFFEINKQDNGSRNSNKEFISISAIRFVSLILVISCHVFQYLNIELAWWFNVGVQIFLLISGWLYGHKKTGHITNFYAKRFRKILLPYYVVYFFMSSLLFLFCRENFSLIKFLGGLFVRSTIAGGTHLWFVPTILMCYVITPLLEAYRDQYFYTKNKFILFAIGSVFITSLFFGAFNKYFNPAWISCYVIGYGLGCNDAKKYIYEFKLLIMFLPVTIITNGIQIYCTYIIHKKFIGFSYYCDYAHVLLGITLFLGMKVLFDACQLHRIEKILTFSDYYSYEIYLIHHFLILGPLSLMAVTPFLWLNLIIILICIGILSWLLKRSENLFKRKYKLNFNHSLMH